MIARAYYEGGWGVVTPILQTPEVAELDLMRFCGAVEEWLDANKPSVGTLTMVVELDDPPTIYDQEAECPPVVDKLDTEDDKPPSTEGES